MKNIAIIPARSGSKGLPNKNIRPLNGVPLMAYTIRAALNSGMFEHVMVSTDSEEYAQIAKEWGAEVPFLRSAATSTDMSSSWSVVREVLDRYEQLGQTFDTVALLQVTSPMRTGENIVQAYKQMEEKGANSLYSICETGYPLNCCMLIPESLDMNEAIQAVEEDPAAYRPRQTQPVVYRSNGAIYLYRVDAFQTDPYPYATKCYGFIMDKIYSTDVDDLEDFTIAEALINHLPEYHNYFDK